MHTATANELAHLRTVSRRTAAELLGIHLVTLDAWVKRGVIRAPMIEGRRLIPVSELERLLNGTDSAQPARPDAKTADEIWASDHST